MRKVLVTGGCGFIGSHTIVDLLEAGFEVESVDNYLNSDPVVLEGIEKITGRRVTNHCIDLADAAQTKAFFAEHYDYVGIIHFAALKSVPDSVSNPLQYYHNNLNSLLNILQALYQHDIQNLIFSSSCSVYGNTEALPVTEETPFQKAECPYAFTKQIGEQMISDFIAIHKGHSATLLRYFNPAGAHESIHIGESALNFALNLVPVITETAIGKRAKMTVFGKDYDTRDGSCIRDYIHVMDLAKAHTLGLQKLLAESSKGSCEVYNLGIGEGVTVLEAIAAFEKVSGQKLNYEVGGRRAGDVVSIYSNFDKAHRELGWTPSRNIENIMDTAWRWEKVRSS
jgi:UDP-glucose 4-epimerase